MSAAHPAAPSGAVAIVGIGCRFPGGASDAASYWRLLSEGVDAITEIPVSRIDLDRYFDPRPATPGRMITRWGGFLDRIDEFDAEFFGISPREAERMDPQQRLLLEAAWEALEDAGQDVHRLEGTRTGVYIGQWLSDFEARLFVDPEAADFYMTTGSGRYSTSGRISYLLGLRGPSLTIDTACSSSLTAVHLAVQSIRSGESGLALAGGVNVILQPHISIAYSQSRMMAPDGRCKFGDASGDGYVRSEGVGVVVLKPLQRALGDGDRIYALIRGSAINNDGRSSGSMGTPSRLGQEELLRSAYADAGVSPALVGYVEAHGTGTLAGDPVELSALGNVLGDGRQPGYPAIVGSVKTNLGHTEGAAGVAGLIKAALALRHGVIPRSLHCQTLNPAITWADSCVEIARAQTAWPSADGPNVAGVSAFGIAGSNAHVVLEEAPRTAPVVTPSTARELHLLPLSARNSSALRVLAARYADRIEHDRAVSLLDLCWSAATRRTALQHRACFVAASHDSMIEGLRSYAAGGPAAAQGVVPESDEAFAKIAFVCPGQGGQYAGMARELLASEPAFSAALGRCDSAARRFVDWSIVEQLALDPGSPGYRLDQIDVIQPVLVALAIAYAELWRSIGVEPAAVVGHSMGEVAAAHIAGVLDLEQAMCIICKRSALMRRASGQGAMALVELSMNDIGARLRGLEDQVEVAAANSPRSCVITGSASAVQQVLGRLEHEQVFCRLINVDVASHSRHMEPLAAELEGELAGLRPGHARLPIYSTVHGRRADGATFDAAYWGANLRRPVLFGKAVERLIGDGLTVFVELGPHPLLLPSIQQTAQSLSEDAVRLGCGRRDTSEVAGILLAFGSLWTTGQPVDWARLMPGGARNVSLPLFPFQRERHWIETRELRTATPADAPDHAAARHPLLRRRFQPAGATGSYWDLTLTPDRFSYLADHRVRGVVVFPAAAYCEMALAAAHDARSGSPWELAKVRFQEALALNAAGATSLQVFVAWSSDTNGRFEIHGRSEGADDEHWTLLASGQLRLPNGVHPATAEMGHGGATPSLDFDAKALYASFADAGLGYGPSFRTLETLALRGTVATATIRLGAEPIDRDASRYAAYPPLLDGALQAMAACAIAELSDPGATILPVSIDRLRLLEALPLDQPLCARLVVRQGAGHTASGDLTLQDGNARTLAVATGVVFAQVRRPASAPVDELLYVPEWVACSPQASTRAAPLGPVLVLADVETSAAPLVEALRAHQVVVKVADAESAGDAVRAFCSDLTTNSAPPGERAAIVHLLALDAPPPSDGAEWIEAAWRLGGDSIVSLAQALSGGGLPTPPRVWLVTRSAVYVGTEDRRLALGQSVMWGLGRVFANEHPSLDVTLVDLDNASSGVLHALLSAGPPERQLALRHGQWHALCIAQKPAAEPAHAVEPVSSFKAALRAPGVPHNLRWRQSARRPPGRQEVEIEVAAVGLNFMNVMSVLGIYPGYEDGQGPLGIECAGRVVRIGPDVQALAPGDEVIAIAPDCLARHAIAHEALVRPRPTSVSLEDAASLPIAFVTAWYALHDLARLQGGERVLIHSAAGGVGLAALQVARHLGADVLATAGTEDKRSFLRSLGIAHVFDSRGCDFADRVHAATGGNGVDVVLNSLAGEAIAAGLDALAPYGRFVELGKRDIHARGMLALPPFRKNLSFFAVDLDAMMRDRPSRMGRLLDEVMARFESSTFQLLPVRRFAADALVDAFQLLLPGTHSGKHVVSLVPAPAGIEVAPGHQARVRHDGSYLITGGLGALGQQVARWLAQRGAGCLVLVGRRAPDPETVQTLRTIESYGCRVLSITCDVTRIEDLQALLARVRGECPPLRGVFHAAGVLADSVLTELGPQTLRMPRDSKVLGAWHLDRLTAPDALDFVVFFSSVASLFGTPGQGNYAAANAFLDSLAYDRQARGLPTLCVNLGPLGDIGLAAASAMRGRSLRRLGFQDISAEQVVHAIDRLLATGVTQAACMAFDAERWRAATRQGDAVGLLGAEASDTVGGAPAEASLAQRLRAAPAGQPRRAIMDAALRAEVAEVLRLAPARVPLERPLKAMGIDSLMALELRNRLERCTALTLSATLTWNHPTLRALGEYLASRLGIPLDAPETAPVFDDPAGPDLDALFTDLASLGEDEARRLLASTEAR